MSESLPQLTRLEIQELYKKDPALVEKARRAGQLAEVNANRNHCPSCTCGRSNEAENN